MDLKYGLEFEEKLNSRDISRNRRVGLGEGIYPNSKDYKLEISRDFKRITDSTFSHRADYHFTKDSTIRVVMYEWNLGKKKNSESVLNKKFIDLKIVLDDYFGESYFTELPTDSLRKNSSRHGIKWRNEDGLSAYLFAFRDRAKNYYQIRLSMYPE